MTICVNQVEEHHEDFSKKLWNLIDYEESSSFWEDQLQSIIFHFELGNTGLAENISKKILQENPHAEQLTIADKNILQALLRTKPWSKMHAEHNSEINLSNSGHELTARYYSHFFKTIRARIKVQSKKPNRSLPGRT